jgi:hypothetical protein
MKFRELSAIAHNLADSLAEGNGFLIGLYHLDVFGEADHAPEGFIEIDFLTGVSNGGFPSDPLAKAFRLYAEVLPSFCQKHGASVSDFRVLKARFFGGGPPRLFSVTVEDRTGRQSTDEYSGSPGKRLRTLDYLGRIRRKPGQVLRTQ